MRYAQVRLFISSILRTNGALFGCASWNGYAHSWLSKWVVQSPGVINNTDGQRTAANTSFFVSNYLLIYRGCDRVSFISLVMHRAMAVPNGHKYNDRGICKTDKGEIRALRSPVRGRVPFGLIVGWTKSQSADFWSPLRRPLRKVHSLDMCSGPKGPIERDEQINHALAVAGR